MHAIEVECLPKDLPEIITIDVSALNVGEGIHVKDIKFPAGVSSRVDGDLTVVRVAAPTVEAEPTPAAEAAAGPEVIKEKKEEGAAAAPAKGAAAPAKPADKK
jgi:large subunit ribosomal protein L25